MARGLVTRLGFGGVGGGSSISGSMNTGSGGGCSMTFGLFRLPAGRPRFFGAGGSGVSSGCSCAETLIAASS